MNCNCTISTADGGFVSFITNTMQPQSGWYWCRLSQVQLPVHTNRAWCVNRACYITGSEEERGEEWREVLRDVPLSSPSFVPLHRIIRTPATKAQSLSVIQINGQFHLLQWWLSLKSPVKVSAYYHRSSRQVERIRCSERERGFWSGLQHWYLFD